MRLTWYQVVVLLASLGVIGCGTRREPSLALSREDYPANVFTLALSVTSSRVIEGEPFEVEYLLTNTSSRSVTACADGWDSFHVWGTQSNIGSRRPSVDGIRPESILRVPPRATLSWRSEIRIRDVGLGPASIRGVFDSRCGWVGSTVSDPVLIEIQSAE
jgi:hypothetical protein